MKKLQDVVVKKIGYNLDWMKMIDFNEDIICFVIHNGTYCWYVADKDLWILDSNHLIESWKKVGYTLLPEWTPEERRSTMVLDSHNVDVFLKQIEYARYSTDELRELLFKEREETLQKGYWYYDLYPSLLIDFDKKVLYNGNPEITAYEDFVPRGWRGFYEDFTNKVPLAYRYWLDDSGVDLFQQFREDKKKG